MDLMLLNCIFNSGYFFVTCFVVVLKRCGGFRVGVLLVLLLGGGLAGFIFRVSYMRM